METRDGIRHSGDLAKHLREVAEHIRHLDVPEEQRAELVRRLIAVTTAAKRDLTVATRRLEQLRYVLETVPKHSPDVAAR